MDFSSRFSTSTSSGSSSFEMPNSRSNSSKACWRRSRTLTSFALILISMLYYVPLIWPKKWKTDWFPVDQMWTKMVKNRIECEPIFPAVRKVGHIYGRGVVRSNRTDPFKKRALRRNAERICLLFLTINRFWYLFKRIIQIYIMYNILWYLMKKKGKIKSKKDYIEN